MLVCFLKALATGIGRDGDGWRVFPFLQRVIPCTMSGIIFGAALFLSPHL